MTALICHLFYRIDLSPIFRTTLINFQFRDHLDGVGQFHRLVVIEDNLWGHLYAISAYNIIFDRIVTKGPH